MARRRLLARLGLAWLGMMQVMMFAFPGYLRSAGMGTDNPALLDQAIYMMNWVSLALTLPVALYCASPVWRGAFAQLKRGRVGMDVPVALGIAAAFIPSAHATLAGRGEVYFDSVTMFVAFLLTARYLALCARQSIFVGTDVQAIERFRDVMSAHANRLALWFVAIQLLLALAAGGVWMLYAPERAIAVVVALLVMSCPCAMAMAVPTVTAAVHATLSVQGDAAPAHVHPLTAAASVVARQNLYGSIAWHLLMTPLAAAGLVAPWVAALTMLISSLAVAGNAWRFFRRETRICAVHWPVAPARS